MNFKRYELNNGIKTIIQDSPNTPRVALEVFIKSANEMSIEAGLATITSRLMLQGTKTKTQEQIAEIIDENGVELHVDSKNDCMRIHSYCLNEDLDLLLELIEDITQNSTFDSVEKECKKLTGEITADLDSPRVKAVDNLVRNLFEDHPYGNSYNKVLANLPTINKEKVQTYYQNIFSPSNIDIAISGDIDDEEMIEKLNRVFGGLSNGANLKTFEVNPIKETKMVTIAKEDAQQAQVIQGWHGAGILDEDYFAMSVLNTILGSCGLSSRLFVELRDKKGLAYVVRSSLEPLKQVGIFTVYIATAPQNIQVSLDGFKEEIAKLQTDLVSEGELINAKQNMVGKRKFFHETNSQRAYYLGFFETMGLGAEFDKKFEDKIKAVTAEQVKDVANKYLSEPSIISILAPEEFLKDIK